MRLLRLYPHLVTLLPTLNSGGDSDVETVLPILPFQLALPSSVTRQ
jgi:hypothetical protein